MAQEPASKAGAPLPLLATKLYVPRVRTALVPRPRLTRRLDEGMERRLVLISAPAGFGKSTLLAEWAQLKSQASPPFPIAWLSLDAGDNDPQRFWTYLVAALNKVRPGTGQDLLALLRAPQPPPIDALLAELLNEIAAIPGDLALVLDDYHTITAQAIHDALAFLLEHLPPQMHLVIAGRTDPPLPLALLRSRGQSIELGAADLRFTADEAAAFLNRAAGTALSPSDIAALEARTEGWAAGLQLAALSMQGVDDVSGFIRGFGGGHRYVFDYLAQEVLARQPESVQAFLLQTAILDRLCGPLCDAVMGLPPAAGRGHGQATLEHLEQANLFIVPLDHERHWYRYHHLFAEFLRGHLAQTQPGAAPTLHRRAAAWFAEHGLTSDAVGHALAAGDLEMAADLVEQAAKEMFARSELITLRGWLEALPIDAMARPRLAMVQAWVTIATTPQQSVAALLDGVERGVQAKPGDDVRGALAEVAILRAVGAMNQGRFEECIALCRQAQAGLAGAEEGLFNSAIALRGTAAFNLGVAYEFTGDLPAASQALAEAVDLSRQAGNLHLAPMALSRLANLQVIQGQLRRAGETYRLAMRLAEEMSKRPSPMAGQVFTGYGDLLREQNELDAAERYLVQGIELGRQWRSADALTGGYIGLARVRQAKGDPGGALQALDELAALSPGAEMPWTRPLVEVCRVRLWAAQRRLEPLGRWLASCGLSPADAPHPWREAEYVALARALIALGRGGEAAPLLERLCAPAEAGGRMGPAIEMLALHALALRADGQAAAARAALLRALRLAAPEGYVRTFLDEGEPMLDALSELAQGAELEGQSEPAELRQFVEHLLAAARTGPRPSSSISSSSSTSSLIEPLSGREIEVLRLVAAGRSNQEIAQALIVSPNTVKTHLKNIYAKLGAASRTQAIARARELGLL